MLHRICTLLPPSHRSLCAVHQVTLTLKSSLSQLCNSHVHEVAQLVVTVRNGCRAHAASASEDCLLQWHCLPPCQVQAQVATQVLTRYHLNGQDLYAHVLAL